MEKLIPINEAAELIGYGPQMLRRWIKKGILKAYKATPGSKYRVKMSDLERLMQSGSPLDEQR
ncbi:hypothetical protein ES703_35270 [subsurface metagenome]